MKRLLASVVLTFILTGGAAAEPVDDAAAAFMGGDYATALRLLRPLAEQGDPYAQTMLGNLYDEGKGVPQDYQEAVKWYRLAAEQGFPQGQDNLGQCTSRAAVRRKATLRRTNGSTSQPRTLPGLQSVSGQIVTSSRPK